MISTERPLWLILILATTLVACSGSESRPMGDGTADPSGSSLTERLDAFFEAARTAHDLPGLTASVVQDGEVVYQRAFGVESLAGDEALTPQHLFHFASVSKPFVATALMQLVEAGKMDLDEKVVTYLPYFRLADGPSEEISIRQMLNHTSGMPDVRDYEWDRPQTDDGAAERYVRSLATERMIGPPGDQCVYSNMAFDTLGDVIATVSGQSFEDYVKANILDPLGMEQSDFLYPRTNETLRTTGHTWNVGPVVSEHYPYNRRHAPSSTLNSSVAEMTRWIRVNLNRGELDGTRILQDASYDLLWGPSARMGQSDVGLSWFLGEADGERIVYHSGGDTGFSSYLVLLPDRNAGMALAVNYDRAPMNLLRDGVIDALQGEDPGRPRRPIGNDVARVYFESGFEAAKAFYLRATEERPDDYLFAHGQLNTFGYLLMRRDDVRDAIRVFEFNVELYPDVGNCHDSLGEAYLAAGRHDDAIASYRRALELDPENDNARQVLARLGASG